MGVFREHVTVILPALNEAQTIANVIQEIRQVLNEKSFDILVVDGRSSDDTVRITQKSGAQVIVQRGVGYGDALICGFAHALRFLKPDIVVMMDADGTYSPRDITALLKPILRDESDFVIGNRFAGLEKGSMSLTNRVGNKFFSSLSRRLFNIPSLDTQSGFRAFKAEMLNNLVFKNPGMSFASEMIVEAKNANYRITQVPVTYKTRVGKSKLKPLTDGSLILGTLIRLYRDYSPLFFFGALGMFFLGIGAILAIYLTIDYAVAGLLPGFVQTITAAVLFISGLIILVMALLADMIKDLRERLRVFEMQLAESLLQDNNKKNSNTDEKPAK
jgi:glycosyltransferase involved in cell wall biosynthesis